MLGVAKNGGWGGLTHTQGRANEIDKDNQILVQKLSSIAINAVCSGMVFGMFLKLKIYDGVVTRLKHLVTGDYSAGPNSIGNEGEARKNNSMIDVKAEADEAIEEHFEAWHRINAGNYFGGVLRHPLKFLTKNASFMPAIIDGSLQLKVRSTSPSYGGFFVAVSARGVPRNGPYSSGSFKAPFALDGCVVPKYI